MAEEYYRCTINNVPEDQSKLKNTAIPVFMSVEFEKEGIPAPTVTDPLIRCEKCKAYLNPYVEIIMPGFKWKCNLCDFVNTVDVAFQMVERKANEFPNDPLRNAEFNRENFTRGELKSDVYEIEAPDSFNVKTPDPPVLCFIIDVSVESQKLGILSSVLGSLREVLKNANYDPRTKACFMFYDENCYVLNNTNAISVISGDLPLILSDRILFSLPKMDSSSATIDSINFEDVEALLSTLKNTTSNLLVPLRIAIQAFRSASIFTFVSTMPNYGVSAIKPSQSLVCSNYEYRQTAESLFKKNLCVNQFIMARSNVEYSTLRVLSQQTGGQTFHYSNFDGTDPVFSSKLYADLADYFNRNIGFGAVCRIRANEGVLLKNIYGNFTQKGADLVGFANYNPAHALNFSLLLFNDVRGALYVQIAMIRVTKTGGRLIRVMNLCIPVRGQTFYTECNANAICQALVLESLASEGSKKGSGGDYLQKSLSAIWREVRDRTSSIPESLYSLPQLVLAARKSIALRPDTSTPTDFRSFYHYIFSNINYRLFDVVVYPTLLNLNDSEVRPLPLTVKSVVNNGLYILDTGVTVFFYVGKECDRLIFKELFGSLRSGPIIFAPEEGEFSNYVIDLLNYLLHGRSIKPRYILADATENTVNSDIFFSYMVDDKLFGLPDIESYRSEVNSIFN